MSSGTAASAEERAAAQRVAAVRWPDGARCPYCDSERVSERNRPERRWPQWRCRDCRKDFTAVTGTAFSRTRRAPSDIEHLLAAPGSSLAPAQDLHAPDSTAQLESAAPSMLRRHAPQGARSGDDPCDDPLRGFTAAEVGLLSALRQRPDGATVARLAEMATVSERHALRSLQRLAAKGFAGSRDETVRDGHRSAAKRLWRLTYSPDCVRLVKHLPRHRAAMPEPAVHDAVPPQFWHLFWSGAQGSELSRSRDEQHIAGTLIGSRDLAAEAWALRNVSVGTLQQLAETRGYDSGDVHALIRAELRRRRNVAA